MDINPDLFQECKLLNQPRRDKGRLSPDAFSEIQGRLCDVCRTAIEWNPKNREDENISLLLNPGWVNWGEDFFEYELKHHMTRESLDRSVNQNCFICVTLWRKIGERGLEVGSWAEPAKCTLQPKAFLYPIFGKSQNIQVAVEYDTAEVISVSYSFAEAIGGSFGQCPFHKSC